jgi:hypothetical protein
VGGRLYMDFGPQYDLFFNHSLVQNLDACIPNGY